MDEEYQKLLMEEQAELATSIQYDAALTALQAKNEAALKDVLQLEQELAAVTSENETLSRFKGFSQEQCFSIKAEHYKIAGEKQKAKEMLHNLDQQETYWKDVGKKEDGITKSCDAHVTGLYKSPWILQMQELKGEIQELRDTYAVKQEEYAKMDNTPQFKSPSNMDTNTLEMFRSKVRSELRLNPAPLQQQPNDSVASNNATTPPRPERSPGRRLEATSSPSAGRLESTPTRKQKEPSRHISSSSSQQTHPPSQQPQHYQQLVDIEPEDDSNLTAGRMEFDDSVRQSQETEQEYDDREGEEEEEPEEEPLYNMNNDLSSDAVNITDDEGAGASPFRQRMLSPTQATPPDARPKPAQNYAPRDDDHLFKVPETPRRHNASPPKKNSNNNVTADDDINFMNLDTSLDNGMDLNTSQDGGNDFYNLLDGDNGGGTPMFSFLQEHTNNSESGGNNFFFGASSPRAQKDESRNNGFLF